MKFVYATLAAAVAASNTQEPVESKCHDNGILEIKVPYTKANSELLAITVGTCNTVDSEFVKFSQDTTHATIEVTMDGCAANFPVGHATRDDPTLSNPKFQTRSGSNNLPFIAGFATFTVDLEIGGKDAKGNDLSMYKAQINTECGTEIDYTVEFDYGVISMQSSSDELREGTYNKEPFQIQAYTDNTYTTTTTTLPSLAGKDIYIGVSPSRSEFRFDRYDYAVLDCTFTNSGNDEATTLFDNGANSCGNPFIELAHTDAKPVWGFTHKLFVYGTKESTSSYKLTCNIKLCDATATTSTCKTARSNCGV
jgi:hypothetical protein